MEDSNKRLLKLEISVRERQESIIHPVKRSSFMTQQPPLRLSHWTFAGSIGLEKSD